MKRCCALLPAALLSLATIPGRGESGSAPADRELNSLQELIMPGPQDSQWMNVSWQPASNLWAARRNAAAEGKPLFLWYMAGEPLGPC
jgi:hypothetical protein